MDANTIKLLQERLEELPEDVQRAIQSSDSEKKIQDIGQKHHLHIDQIEKLDDETRLVMLGFVEPEDFANQIGIGVNVSPQEADAMAAEISAALFVPIRESMQRFMDERVLQAQLLKEEKPTSPVAVSQSAPGKNISVVMPSSAPTPPTAPAAPLAEPVRGQAAPAPIKPTPTPAPIAKPQLDLPAPVNAADMMLSESTISMAPPAWQAKPAPPTPPAQVTPPTPAGQAKVEPPKAARPYKADPYREPLE